MPQDHDKNVDRTIILTSFGKIDKLDVIKVDSENETSKILVRLQFDANLAKNRLSGVGAIPMGEGSFSATGRFMYRERTYVEECFVFVPSIQRNSIGHRILDEAYLITKLPLRAYDQQQTLSILEIILSRKIESLPTFETY